MVSRKARRFSIPPDMNLPEQSTTASASMVSLPLCPTLPATRSCFPGGEAGDAAALDFGAEFVKPRLEMLPQPKPGHGRRQGEEFVNGGLRADLEFVEDFAPLSAGRIAGAPPRRSRPGRRGLFGRSMKAAGPAARKEASSGRTVRVRPEFDGGRARPHPDPDPGGVLGRDLAPHGGVEIGEGVDVEGERLLHSRRFGLAAALMWSEVNFKVPSAVKQGVSFSRLPSRGVRSLREEFGGDDADDPEYGLGGIIGALARRE